MDQNQLLHQKKAKGSTLKEKKKSWVKFRVLKTGEIHIPSSGREGHGT